MERRGKGTDGGDLAKESPVQSREEARADFPAAIEGDAIALEFDLVVTALQQQVGDYRRALQRLAAVSEVTAGVVHDVRNALHVALFQSSYLEGVLHTPEYVESARSIHHASVHAERLLKDLLSLARGRGTRVTVVDAAEMLDRCRRLVERVVRRPVECAFHADRGVWHVAVEPHQLEAALINLSANARDAMPDGGSLVLTVRNVARGSAEIPRSLADDDYVVYLVQDTGSGMPPDVLARATEAFFTTKAGESGSGLGLAMVQAFAQRHGGGLVLESAPERGTTAKVFLPRAVTPVTSDEACRPDVREALASIRPRISKPWMGEVLDAWRAACPQEGFPRPICMEAALESLQDVTVVLTVDREVSPPALHLLRLGEALARSRHVEVDDPHPLPPSILTLTRYREVLALGLPVLELAHGLLGPGDPVEFERLILPAASDGRRVSHLYGVMAIPLSARA